MTFISLKKIRFCLTFGALFSYIFLSSNTANCSAIINKIRLSNEQKQLEIVINQKREFRPFILENPPRLVIDIADAKSLNLQTIDDKTNIIKSAKISKYSKNNQEYLRIILNLDRKITIDNARFQKVRSENLGKIIVKLDGDFKAKSFAKKQQIVIEKETEDIDDAIDNKSDQELKYSNISGAGSKDDLGNLVAKVTDIDLPNDSNMAALDKKIIIDQVKDPEFEVKTSKIILPDGSVKYVIKKYSTTEDVEVKQGNEASKYSKNSLAVIKKKPIPIIVIDPGHGGKDPGTIGNYARIKEKNITLAYGRELKIALDKTKKYKVYLTRNSDIFIPLSRRVEMARKVKADLFISLHANSAANKKASGLSIYTLSENSSDKQAELLAQKENRSDIIAGANFSDASPDIMKTLINLSQRDSMNNSAIYANLAIKSVQNFDIEILNNTHRFAGFRVLTAPDMVSVLIELGYLSNKSEEKKLNDFKYRKKLAASLVASIESYFSPRP